VEAHGIAVDDLDTPQGRPEAARGARYARRQLLVGLRL
jgi:hypothetical protein